MDGMFSLGGMAAYLKGPWRIDVGVEGRWLFLSFWIVPELQKEEDNTRKLAQSRGIF